MIIVLANDFVVAGGAETVFRKHLDLFKNRSEFSIRSLIFKGENSFRSFLSVLSVILMIAVKLLGNHRVFVVIYNFSTFNGIFFVFFLWILKGLFGDLFVINSVHDYYLLFPTRDGLAYSKKNSNVVNLYEKEETGVRYDRFFSRHLFKLIRHILINNLVVGGGVFSLLVSPSTHLAGKLRRAYPRLRVTVIRNPLDELPVLELKSSVISHYLIIGRLTVDKGVDESLKYWSDCLSDKPLFIIGRGPLEYELQRFVQDLPLDKKNKVNFMGWIERSEVMEKMKNGSILFGSLWTENAPMVFLEAALSGGKVLVTRRSACVREFQRILPGIFENYCREGDGVANYLLMFSESRFVHRWLKYLK